MSKDHIESKQWHAVDMPLDLSADSLKRLILICGHLVIARVVNNKGRTQCIEIYCAGGEECAQAEALIHQAAADEQLRQTIHRESDPEITSLVTNILNRAFGG